MIFDHRVAIERLLGFFFSGSASLKLVACQIKGRVLKALKEAPLLFPGFSTHLVIHLEIVGFKRDE